MGDIVLFIILFTIGCIIIFLAADIFLDNLKKICLIYGVSPFIIGLLVLGIDPEESIVSIIAAINGLPYMAMGNVIGNSIIALTISFAIPSFFYKIDFKSVSQFYFTLIYTCLILILIGFLISFSLFVVGIISLFLFIIYLYRNLKQISKGNAVEITSTEENISSYSEIQELKQKSKFKKIMLIIVSFTFIFLGGELLVYSSEQIIMQTTISETFFGVVIIAFVTNIEELTLVLKSIKKNSVEIGLGGMIGKIFWNLAITFGISAIIIINFNFIWIFFWNWLILFILIIYFNRVAKKKSLDWKDGVVLTFFLLIFLTVNFIAII